MLALLCHPERDDPCTMTNPRRGRTLGDADGAEAPTDGRRLKLKGHLVRSGVPAGPTAYGARLPG